MSLDYAYKRGVNIVPEIELPGHCVAALAAYPEYSCTGGPFEVEKDWGVFKDIYCAGNDSTFVFLENILDEIIELFPSKYFILVEMKLQNTDGKTAKMQKENQR